MDIQTALNYTWQVIGLIVGGTFVIQVAPIQINPWGWFLKRLGKVVNEDLNQTIENLAENVSELEKKVDNLDEEQAEKEAKHSRRRILRFADECRREEKHSLEHFNEIIEGDIKGYRQYCKDNPNFENDKCVMSISFIESAYKHCLENNDFL